MTERVCRALKGERGMRECSFVYLSGIEGGQAISETLQVDYLSAPVEFTVSRLDDMLMLGHRCLERLNADI